jgi:hypothetical protein
VIAGTLRSPWKWEELVVESAVVGGRTRADGGRRWRRRLGGLAADYRLRIAELRRDEPESARIPAFERDLKNLGHLREFALPIVDELAQWPDATTWGEWLDRFVELAGRALRRPDRVLDVLSSLRPMASVETGDARRRRDVRDRLVTLDWPPLLRRYGRVFVGTPHQARGRAFASCLSRLAERVVPQRPHEDPLLLDERPSTDRRAARGAGRSQRRGASAAQTVDRRRRERLCSRIRGWTSRRREPACPPFMRWMSSGRLPARSRTTRKLATGAAEEAGASLAWPARRIRSRHRRSRARPGVAQAAARLRDPHPSGDRRGICSI